MFFHGDWNYANRFRFSFLSFMLVKQIKEIVLFSKTVLYHRYQISEKLLKIFKMLAQKKKN